MLVGLGGAALGIVTLFGFEFWASRGTASEEEITLHRLREHHGFDPERGKYNIEIPPAKEEESLRQLSRCPMSTAAPKGG